MNFQKFISRLLIFYDNSWTCYSEGEGEGEGGSGSLFAVII